MAASELEGDSITAVWPRVLGGGEERFKFAMWARCADGEGGTVLTLSITVGIVGPGPIGTVPVHFSITYATYITCFAVLLYIEL
jgi:hypothetical protein